MDFPDEECLKKTVERLTRENARLRSQLAVTQQWNPPGDLEQAFRNARGWECLTVSPLSGRPILILISGAGPEEAPQDEAGEVWRHLQTAAPPGSRIGPFARAWMPGRLLGYLREHGGQTVIVLNRDLHRGQVSRAARMLRASAKQRERPATRFLGLSIVPILSMMTLLHGGTAQAGFTAAPPPAATSAMNGAPAAGTAAIFAPPMSSAVYRPPAAAVRRRAQPSPCRRSSRDRSASPGASSSGP